MNVPYWLLRLLPMWEYICPKCRNEVKKNSHRCLHCGERFPLAIRVPPSFLKDPKKLEAYVHKHVFPRVSEFERNYLTQYFTTLFSDGFESNDFSAWTGTTTGNGGTIAVQSSTKHHGSYASRAYQGGVGAWAVAYKNFGTTYSTMYARAYLQFSGTPASGARLDIYPTIFEGASAAHVLAGAQLYNNAGTLNWSLQYRTNATETNYAYSTTPSIQANTWYCIEARFTSGNGNGQVSLYIDGTLIINVTGLTNNAYNAGRVEVGAYCGNANTGIYVYHDCVVVADAYIGTEGTLQTVTDSLSLADTLLRHKTLLPITQAISLSDSVFRNKTLSVADTVGAADSMLSNKTLNATDLIALAETVKALKTLVIADQIQLAELLDVLKGGILKSVADSLGLVDSVMLDKVLSIADSMALLDSAATPSRVLQALEAIGLADNSVVNKVLQITEIVSLAEVVQVGAGGAQKTKLFLILGDLALQLTGD
jgi:DNA-directed RNA polymerase subunit RPC12/RpoP